MMRKQKRDKDLRKLQRRAEKLMTHALKHFPDGINEERLAASIGWSIDTVVETLEFCESVGLLIRAEAMPEALRGDGYPDPTPADFAEAMAMGERWARADQLLPELVYRDGDGWHGTEELHRWIEDGFLEARLAPDGAIEVRITEVGIPIMAKVIAAEAAWATSSELPEAL